MAKIKICNCGCGTEFIPAKLGQKQVNQSHYITWLIHTPEGQKKQAEAKEKAKKIIANKEAKNKSAIEWQQKANDNWLKFKREQKKEKLLNKHAINFDSYLKCFICKNELIKWICVLEMN
jgi:hypothetical protein